VFIGVEVVVESVGVIVGVLSPVLIMSLANVVAIFVVGVLFVVVVVVILVVVVA